MKLSLAEQYFKYLILTSPIIFKTRWDCIAFIFTLSGNNYHFNESGDLTVSGEPITFDEKISKINRNYLNTPKPYKKDPSHNDIVSDFDELCYLQDLASYDYENMQLSFIEQHIDTICKTKVETYPKKPSIDQISNLVEYSLFFQTPTNVNKVWINIVIEAGETIKKLLVKKDHLGKTAFDPNNWKNVESYNLYCKINEKLETLDPGRTKRISDNIQKVIDALTKPQ